MKFSETHEWVEMDHSIGIVGVSDYAQKELGDIVYVELPEVGKEINAGEEAVVLESTKAASDVYSPISGKILEVNNALLESPELINESPENDGWLFKIEMTKIDEMESLLDKEKYQTMIQA